MLCRMFDLPLLSDELFVQFAFFGGYCYEIRSKEYLQVVVSAFWRLLFALRFQDIYITFLIIRAFNLSAFNSATI